MNFKFEKTGKHVNLIIYRENEPTILEEIVLSKRTYIHDKTPNSKDEFIRVMNLHVNSGDVPSCKNFHNEYYTSMKNIIEKETREIAKSFMRIEQALKCINISQSIEFSDTDYYRDKS